MPRLPALLQILRRLPDAFLIPGQKVLDDPAVRDVKLREWWRLPEKMYLLLEDGTRVWAQFDERQRGEDRVSSVQYMKFNTGGRVPVGAGVDLPKLQADTKLTAEQRQALNEDLSS
jgi:hypothetical protein